MGFTGEVEADGAALRRIFDGIGEQVVEDMLQQTAIEVDLGAISLTAKTKLAFFSSTYLLRSDKRRSHLEVRG